MNHLKILIVLLSLALLPVANALSTDGTQPVVIRSDQFYYSAADNTGNYVGHVIVDQGSRHLIADKITVTLNAEKQVSEINAYGSPAKFNYQPNPGDKLVYASANTIQYDPTQDLLSLKQNAEIEQAGNVFKGSEITYNTKTQIAESNGSNMTNRPLMIIQPQQVNLHAS